MGFSTSFLDRPTYGLSNDELMSRLDDIVSLERRCAAARLEAISEICARGIPAARGYAHPTGMLRDHLKLTGPAAGQMHRLAKALPNRPETADALAKGDISETQAAVITRTITDIAPYASAGEQTRAAEMLVSQAVVLPPKELTVSGNRILHHIAPEVADKRDREAVEKLERSAWESRSFSITDDGHGRFRFRGTTTAEGAALLHTILDPLTHPKRATTPTPATDPTMAAGSEAAAETTAETTAAQSSASAGTTASDSAPADSASAHSAPADSASADPAPSDPAPSDPAPADSASADPAPSDPAPADSSQCGAAARGQDRLPPAFRDPRTAQQRRHDALVDACRLLLASDRLPENGGSKPQVTVTAGFDAISRQLTGGTLDTGIPLSAEEARRMSCDAGILPAVLDGHGVPLDLGRERRLVTGSLRKALVLRDRGCAFPGCDRPPRWCHGHHCRHWSDGGETCLSNICLLCSFHHGRLHHEDGWTVDIGADGHAWFTAPPWLDPQQTPRRNLYHA